MPRRLPGCGNAGTGSRTPSASTLTPARCGGLRSARRHSRAASRPRSMPTGTGRPPVPVTGRAAGSGSRGSRRGPRPATGSPSPPARSGPDQTATARHPAQIGPVRVHENTRRLEQLIANGRARVLAATVSRRGTRLVVAFRVLIQRPIQPRAGDPESRVGVDVGVRVLATVAGQHGEVIERAPNPRPLEAALKELRHLSRERSRRTDSTATPRPSGRSPGCNAGPPRPQPPPPQPDHQARQNPRRDRGRRLGRGRDAPTEGPAGRTRPQVRPVRLRPRRDPPPAGLQDRMVRLPPRHSGPLVPLLQDLPRLQARAGDRMEPTLDLHRVRAAASATTTPPLTSRATEPLTTSDSALGPVRAAVKRGADRKTRPRRAGGNETRKGTSRQAGNNPQTGC